MITENPFGLPGLCWCEGQISEVATDLSQLPEALRGAVPKRQNEFLAGRFCAAQALRAAGLPEMVGIKDRAPIWPKGAVGSISHSDSRVVAVVSVVHSGMGVDIEPIMAATQVQEIKGLILTESEAAMCPADLKFPEFLTLVFSAKESLYKALSSRLPQMPAFLDVTLLEVSANTLTLRLGGHTLAAHYILTEADVLTLVVVA